MIPSINLKQGASAGFLWALILALTVGLMAGCGHEKDRPSDNASHLHVDTPPHGGTPVALGEEYQIEWVLDSSAGKLQAYVLDGEMEKFVRIAAPSLDLTLKLPGHEETLHLAAIANTATGEKVGSTSQFEAQAEWLKSVKTFDALLKGINIEGTMFSNVAFSFPKGTEH